MKPALENRLDFLIQRLATAYDGIGHSSGRPYIYFVYPPGEERRMRRLIAENMQMVQDLCFCSVDLLSLTVDSITGQEERRQALLDDPLRGKNAAQSLARRWAQELATAIDAQVRQCAPDMRPVVLLLGLAALHPVTNPTALMEGVAEEENRHPHTGRAIPIVIFVPGERPAQTSRTYNFLGRTDLSMTFYRGEEV